MTKDHTVSQDDSGLGGIKSGGGHTREWWADRARAEDGYIIAAGAPRPAMTFTEVCRKALADQPDKGAFTLSRQGLELLVAESERYAGLGPMKGPTTLLGIAVRHAREAMANAFIYIEARSGWGPDPITEHLRNSLEEARRELADGLKIATSDPSPLSAQLGATGIDQGREEPK